MGKLLCEKNLRDVWCRNEGVRAEIGQILHTHTHTRLSYSSIDAQLISWALINAGVLCFMISCIRTAESVHRQYIGVFFMYFVTSF